MRECGLEPLQFNCFCATMRLYNSLTQFRILLGTSERERERERERDTRSFGHPTLPNGCPREHNSKTLITDGVHYKISLGYSFSLQPSQVHVPRPPTRCHSQCWPFQTACPHPSLWDRNMEPQLLPYLWFAWSWWWCPGWTACYFPLHTPPYSHPHTVSLRRRYESLFSKARAQDVLTFCTRTTTNAIFLYINWAG